MHDDANDQIKKGEYYMNMNDDTKSDLFDDSIVEFENSLELSLKKFSVLKRKIMEFTEFMA